MKKTVYKPEDIVITPFDTADYLTSDEMIAGYLALSLEEPDPDFFLESLWNAVRAKGVDAIAKATGLAREALQRACKPGKKPHFETIMKITKALGVPLAPAMPGKKEKTVTNPPKRRRKREAVTA